ncbi:AAA family ATPase [Microbacterium testaceum]|uniref:AAA family ATPase n=1 Tax=Microbacterium testaceum TaxID=2033 RepID=UPI001D179932|nr:ATP-binding protein [Microbacterium testaceum]MCC4249671.1 ATP-binding protein [Microbacterium testaceum]
MLIDFTVANFRSIRDRQSLTLDRSARGTREAREAGWRRPDILPVSVIYGGNAAGKTSLIDAVGYLISAVENSYASWKPRGGTGRREPFRLDRAHSNQPTEVDVEFVAGDGLEYRYGFAIDDERVVSEYLHVFRTRRRSVLFERELDDYKFGDSFRGPASLLRGTTRPNALFLSAAAAAGLDATEAAHAWITETLAVYAATDYRAEHHHVKQRMSEDPGYRAHMTALMESAGLGVVGLDVKRHELPSEERARIRKLLEAQNELNNIDEILRTIESEIVLRHRGEDMDVDLPFDAESDGTHALLSFGSLTYRALEQGTVCVVDEIDTSLHPLLVRELVAVFTDPRINVHQAQLIFTTHDVSLLGAGTPIDRESVWVAEKSHTGATSLYPLTEYGTPRKEENLERGYMTGRFGGLPNLSIANTFLALVTSGD